MPNGQYDLAIVRFVVVPTGRQNNNTKKMKRVYIVWIVNCYG
eukprot:SAG31_NODE_38882_length_292_cov_1.331606_1_plen_41_part_01